MNKRLDGYLQKLDYELRLLPEERRAEELREIRQHLEAIVARLMEGGISEEEATEAATAQFGQAREVGHELVKVVPTTESPMRLLAASVCSVTCYLSLSVLYLLLSINPTFFIVGLISIPLFFATPWIAATVFRCLAPGSLRARSGTAFWLFTGATCLLFAALVLVP